jgi:hypothetical protein
MQPYSTFIPGNWHITDARPTICSNILLGVMCVLCNARKRFIICITYIVRFKVIELHLQVQAWQMMWDIFSSSFLEETQISSYGGLRALRYESSDWVLTLWSGGSSLSLFGMWPR